MTCWIGGLPNCYLRVQSFILLSLKSMAKPPMTSMNAGSGFKISHYFFHKSIFVLQDKMRKVEAVLVIFFLKKKIL